MATITKAELVALVQGVRGVAIIGLESLTDTKARKTGNPFGQIFKRVRSAGLVGANYEGAVHREAGRQGSDSQDFAAEALPWGEWLIPGKVITHNGKLYLRTQSTPGQRRKVSARVLGYFDKNMKALAREDVKPFLPVARESAKQQDDAGLVSTVWVRTYAFDSLQRVRFQGVSYKVA